MTSRNPWTSILLGGTLLLASSCSKSENAPAPAAPATPAAQSTEITAETKEGKPLELLFVLKQQDIKADGSRVLTIGGTYKGAEVGLIVVLGAKWETVAPDPKSKFAFHTGTVEYCTIGDPSNALLAALDELYGTKLAPHAMRASTKFTAASLQGDPADLAKGEVRLKLALEGAEPAQAAELYTNIDLTKHTLRICEKDEGYRKALVSALRKD